MGIFGHKSTNTRVPTVRGVTLFARIRPQIGKRETLDPCGQLLQCSIFKGTRRQLDTVTIDDFAEYFRGYVVGSSGQKNHPVPDFQIDGTEGTRIGKYETFRAVGPDHHA